jgi:hypothetical protein
VPTPLDLQCDAILAAASSAALGIVVFTHNPAKARAALYAYRSKLGKPEYNNLQIRVSPTASETEIWIIRTTSVTLSVANATPAPDLV